MGEGRCCCSCRAPCSGEVMEAMLASGTDYSIFFYNPNIHPTREYNLPKEENIRFAQKHNVSFVDADYDPDNWFARAKGMEWEPERGARCTMCFDGRTALYAHENGFNGRGVPRRRALRSRPGGPTSGLSPAHGDRRSRWGTGLSSSTNCRRRGARPSAVSERCRHPRRCRYPSYRRIAIL